MKVLGLVGSRRVLGNAEVLVKEALAGARSQGADVELLRLTDLRIEPCRGCLACAVKGNPCRLPDDLHFLMNAMERADGIVLGTPVYFFGAPGIIKLLLDRCLTIRPGQFDGKKAVTLGVAGQAKWARMFHSQVNALTLCAGFDLIACQVFESPGPAEVLLDPENPRLARDLGVTLVASIGGAPRRVESDGTHCPICFGQSFLMVSPGRVECPLCYVQGDVVTRDDGTVAIKFEENPRFRFCGENTREDHLDHWVRRTVPRFRERLRGIRAARQPYEKSDIPWLAPER